MAINFDKFDKMVNTEDLKKQINAAPDNSPVPKGRYICTFDKMELKETKDGKGILFASQLRIKENLDGKGQINRVIFFNRKIFGNTPNSKGTWNDGVAIKGVESWLKKLQTETEPNFETYAQFAENVEDIFNEIKGAIEVEISYDDKEFNSITINEVYDI